MSLSKKKDSPYYYIRFCIKGIRIQESSYTDNKALAREYENKRKQEVRDQILMGNQPKKLWSEASTRWVKESQHKRTINQDIRYLKSIDKAFKDKYINFISINDIESCIKTKRATSSPASENRKLALIKSILRRAQNEWGWVNKIPHIKMRKEPSGRIRYLTYIEANRLIKELPTHLKLMAQFTLATGLRQRNVTSLKWDSIDLDNKRLVIPGKYFKNGKDFGIPLNEDAYNLLLVIRKSNYYHPVYIFTYNMKPIIQVSTRAWFKALKRAQIQDFRWHDLRHTWASWFVQNGGSLQELQALGGWSSFNMVLRYAHLCPDNLRKASNIVSGLLQTS